MTFHADIDDRFFVAFAVDCIMNVAMTRYALDTVIGVDTVDIVGGLLRVTTLAPDIFDLDLALHVFVELHAGQVAAGAAVAAMGRTDEILFADQVIMTIEAFG